jgi:transaldolase
MTLDSVADKLEEEVVDRESISIINIKDILSNNKESSLETGTSNRDSSTNKVDEEVLGATTMTEPPEKSGHER